MIQQFIDRYKQMRTERYLRQTYQYQYVFVGMGQHSLSCLYPVLRHLGVPLKYICVTSERKTRLIECKFPGTRATTSLDEAMSDESVKGVFVSASPSAHFAIASQVLRSGKSLFIEKPPCQTLEELDCLIDLQRHYGSPVAMAGLQKRYAPAILLLKKRLRREQLLSYDLHYLTGNYPEGDALLDLFIHPLDLVTHLFGKSEIIALRPTAPASYVLMLQHQHIVGTLELSTAYTWTDAEETLKVCTHNGIYRLSQMEKLTFTPQSTSLFGIPTEKLMSQHQSVEYLCHRNNFLPILPNNQIYSQGYFNEVKSFVNAVEGQHHRIASSLEAMRDTYLLLNHIMNQ